MKKVAIGVALLMPVSFTYAADGHVPGDGYYASYADAVVRGGDVVAAPLGATVRAGCHSPQLFVLRDLKNRERALLALIENIDRRLALASRDFAGSPRSAALMQQVGSLETEGSTAYDELHRVQDEIARLTAPQDEEEIAEDYEYESADE